MLIQILVASLLAGAAPSKASRAVTSSPVTESSDVSLEKLARLIECKTSQVADYNTFAWATQDKATLKRLGMAEVDQDNPFLVEYRLKTPIRVFNRETSRICFASAGVMAIFADVKPEELAKELKLTLFLRTSDKVMYARALQNKALNSDGGDIKAREIIRLNVSTVESHPGRVLAGCEYRVDVE